MRRRALRWGAVATVVLGSGTSFADVLYSQDFDAAGQAALAQLGEAASGASAPPGWVVMANNAIVTTNLTVAGGSQPTFPATTGYYGTGDGLDYSLDVYKSNNTPTFYILFTYTAPGRVTNLRVSFDFENPFCRSSSATPLLGRFNNGFRYHLGGPIVSGRGYAWGTLLDGGLSVSNAGVAVAQDWYVDAEMDALSLSLRGRTAALVGVALEAGQQITFGWFAYLDGDGRGKRMMIGVDNFVLEGDLDACPDDPLKTAPGACGCGIPDTDGDGDGAADCIDGCPADPLKTAPGACGCGVADGDADGDGTLDCHDDCPFDPAKSVPGTCGCGTPETDSDGDLVPDCIDQCPNEPTLVHPGVCGCDPSTWSIPGQVALGWDDLESLSWLPPLEFGAGTAPLYSVLRSTRPDDFLGPVAECVASDASQTTFRDAETPWPGEVYFYLVRAANPCGGSAGTDSSGFERPARECPTRLRTVPRPFRLAPAPAALRGGAGATASPEAALEREPCP